RSLEDWYRSRAIYWFNEILKECLLLFHKKQALPVQEIEIEIRKMEKRWGSCTVDGKIFLQPDLIRAAKPCIEYVIIHELCHLVHHNHTRDFYELQGRILPDWE